MSIGIIQGCDLGQHGKVGIYHLRLTGPAVGGGQVTEDIHACAYCTADVIQDDDFSVGFLDYRCPDCDHHVDGHEVILVKQGGLPDDETLTPGLANFVGCSRCGVMVDIDEAKQGD